VGPVATAPSLPPDSRLRSLYEGVLTSLPADAQTLVTVVVVGEQLELDVLARAAAELGADLGAVTDAEQAGLLLVTGDAVDVACPVVRTALRAALPMSRQLTAHRVLADVLDLERHRLRRALHRAAAVAPTKHDDTSRDLVAAAAAARDQGDHVWAARGFRRAAELAAADEQRANLLLDAAHCACRAGALSASRGFARQA
nr:hypothetical protein [Micromonospora sp. DSM 115978]